MILMAGKFYRSNDGKAWCCFKTCGANEEQAQAFCIRVEDNVVEYFYRDGRYDPAGKHPKSLVEELYNDRDDWGYS